MEAPSLQQWTTGIACLLPDQDVVDWNVNKLDEEPNESHDQETNSSCPSNLGEFFSVRLCALLHQVNRVLSELL